MDELSFAIEDPRSAEVRGILERHLAFANTHSPPEDVHALDLDGLCNAAVTLFGCRIDGELLAVGAIKELSGRHAELKSMHTVAEARGRGLGRAMVERLLGEARRRGYERVSLETGTMDAFVPARTMYAAVGFEPCGPFADHRESPSSTFMTRRLV